MEPRVIFEDRDWLVLDKPAGWLSVAGAFDPRPVVVDWARERFGEILPVHRLDVQTSGVLLLGRHADSHREASLWFQRHEVKKAYDFLAAGSPSLPMFKRKDPIAGQSSTTQVEVRKRGTLGFLGRAVPLTGRRHQIRIHLAEAGHPLWGDPDYGGAKEVGEGPAAFPVARVALHAARLEIPKGRLSVTAFVAPWPEDFRGWAARIGAEESAR